MSNSTMVAGEAADLVAAIFDRGLAMRAIMQQRQEAVRARHADDSKPTPAGREAYKEAMAKFDEAEQANLEDMVVDIRRLAVGAAGAVFRIAEALQTIAENTGPGSGK